MPTLPKEYDWTNYLWLVYLVYFAVWPFLAGSPDWQKVAAIGITVASAGLYLWGYRQSGGRALWAAGGFLLFATLFASTNPGATSFYIYAACLVGRVGEPAVAYRYLAALVAIIGVEAWALKLQPYVWITAVVFSIMLGLVIIHQVQRNRLTRKLIMAQEEVGHLATVAERERIARDLHDLLGHTLSVVILKSELASRLAATDPARAVSEIRDVERIAREALTQVRSAVRGYRSMGFESEVNQARQTLETAGIQVETSVKPPPLSPAQESVFALALREAVTNVVRHAQATVCRLTLRQDGAFCELEIADNGRGGAFTEGSGLSGMRERVQAMGGDVERDGSKGTLLRIRVPV